MFHAHLRCIIIYCCREQPASRQSVLAHDDDGDLRDAASLRRHTDLPASASTPLCDAGECGGRKVREVLRQGECCVVYLPVPNTYQLTVNIQMFCSQSES